jgi:hypothetical protein
MNIVNSVGIFSESAAMNSNFNEKYQDEEFFMNSAKSITSPKLPSVNLNV